MRRRWFWHRQAYGPRTWPWVLLSMAVALIVVELAGTTLLGSIIVGVAAGLVIPQTAWWRWRRRHPVLSTHELLARQRAAAPWN